MYQKDALISYSSAILPKINHYIVKHGKLEIRQTNEPEINYRWIPYTPQNKPTDQDYYKQTVRQLQDQIKLLQQALFKNLQNQPKQFNKSEQQQCCKNHKKQIDQIIRQYQFKLNLAQQRLRQRSIQLQVKDTTIKMKQAQLRQKYLQLSLKQEQLIKKDQLIQYQLKVVDKLIREISQKQKEGLSDQQQFDQYQNQVAYQSCQSLQEDIEGEQSEQLNSPIQLMISCKDGLQQTSQKKQGKIKTTNTSSSGTLSAQLHDIQENNNSLTDYLKSWNKWTTPQANRSIIMQSFDESSSKQSSNDVAIGSLNNLVTNLVNKFK